MAHIYRCKRVAIYRVRELQVSKQGMGILANALLCVSCYSSNGQSTWASYSRVYTCSLSIYVLRWFVYIYVLRAVYMYVIAVRITARCSARIYGEAWLRGWKSAGGWGDQDQREGGRERGIARGLELDVTKSIEGWRVRVAEEPRGGVGQEYEHAQNLDTLSAAASAAGRTG